MGNAESMSSTMEQENSIADNEIVATTTSRRRRRRRYETVTIMPDDENSWWSTIENENLILEEAPSAELTSVRRRAAAAAAAASESENRAVKRIEQKFANENSNLTLKCDRQRQRQNGPTDDDDDDAVAEKLTKSENLELQKVELSERTERAAAREQSLEEFREELRQKRLARQTAVQDLRDEIQTLRKQLAESEQARSNKTTNTVSSSGSDGSIRQKLQHDENESGVGSNNVEGLTSSTVENVQISASKSTNAADEEGASACFTNKTTLPDSMEAEDADDVDPMSRGRHANIELANAQLALQLANSENISLRAELGVIQKQVGTLKEVISCCKQMLAVKEEQCNELKAKLTDIETSFGEREMKIMSENLRHEYERQLGNIRQLRELYEERQRISAAEHENLQRLISIKKDELLAEQEKTKNFEERNQTLIKEVENANNELATLREECNEHKFEKKALKEEMGAVNTLFSQMVMGFNGKNNLDIDRLTAMLEENRTLLNDMATKEASCTDGATLPKLLFELVEQAMHVGSTKTSRSPTPTNDGECESSTSDVDDNDDVGNVAGETLEAEENQRHNNETVEAANMNNEAASTAEVADAIADAVDHALNATTAATAIIEQLKSVDGCGSAVVDSNVVVGANAAIKNLKRQNQRRKMQATASSSTSAEAGAKMASTAALKFHETEVIGKVTSAQEIVGNLPKVWKVLMELLSHHKIEQTQFEENGNSEDCYKSVETPNGPKAELSVSKTYIKLKDLILEKKSLVKETNRLKTLNSHLEYRLNAQEKRLSTVSMELTKTWHLVGKMQRQHRQLHTQEQILRYQLQQKRRLLSELKEELEYCRRKWAAARAKNDESQEQCNDLRREFARRKLEDANNSAESGYSDSGPASDEEGLHGKHNGSGNGNGNSNDNNNGGTAAAAAAGVCLNSRRKHLREMFEHTRKIKRMQSTSPGRAAAAAAAGGLVPNADEAATCSRNNATQETEIILRWNSAPPTCGWRRRRREHETGHGRDNDVDVDNDDDEDGSSREEDLPPRLLAVPSSRGGSNNRGAIPKEQGGSRLANPDVGSDTEVAGGSGSASGSGNGNGERACRIQRLEEQCKSLIQQVLETSDNRERLEIQLCRFQDAIAPVQHAVPLEEFINRRRTERMSRASSAPATGSLTPREEEYTRKRSERLERLEEESRQLMSRIKRTSDRGHYLRCSLDRIRRGPSRENSFDSATEDDSASGSVGSKKVNDEATATAATVNEQEADKMEISVDASNASTPLTAEEEAYTARRTARLKRLEAEGRELLGTLARNAQRGDAFESKLDTLHERYGGNGNGDGNNNGKQDNNVNSSTQTTNQMQSTLNIEQRLENIDQVTASRAERLRLLEEEGNQLIARLSSTSERGTRMINRIAEREQKREARLSVAPLPPTNVESEQENLLADDTAACSGSNTVGMPSDTDSQVTARETGAIPKSKPTAQLYAARHKSERFAEEKKNAQNASSSTAESLEELVKRLKETPFPETPAAAAAAAGDAAAETTSKSVEVDEVPIENDEQPVDADKSDL